MGGLPSDARPSNSRAYCDRGPTRTPCYVDDRAEWLPGRQSGIWVHRQAAMNSRPAILIVARLGTIIQACICMHATIRLGPPLYK
jgi:hypothetical protein